jgi:glutamyl-tRNA reductase
MEKDVEEGSKDFYEQIKDDLSERMIGKIKFDKENLKNVIYKEVIQILEPLEGREKYKGNAHHLTQDIVEKVTSAIMEKMDVPK